VKEARSDIAFSPNRLGYLSTLVQIQPLLRYEAAMERFREGGLVEAFEELGCA
jgi:hypothetical protein